MQEKVTKEIATKEVTAWLDYKRTKEAQRESLKGQIDTLVEAVMFGDVSINPDTQVITHKLIVPEATDKLYTELEYKPRISVGELQKASTNVKATDFDGKVVAYISALTGKGISHIQKLDSEDFKIGQAIALFFM